MDDDELKQARADKKSLQKILEKETHLKNQVNETMNTRDEIGEFVWDDLIGQDFPAKDARALVHNVNTGKFRDAAKGMLFQGPPGIGKDVLVNIMTYQMNGATLFDIPHDFGARQPRIWEYLIHVAYERSPAIIYFNECDGVFKGATNILAIKRAWNVGIMSGGYVLMLGSTNNVNNIDDAIVNRFGDPYKFDPLTPEHRCLLVKRKILGSYDDTDEAKADLEAADDAEWLQLVDLIPEGKNPRWVVVDLIPKVKSLYNYQVDKGDPRRTTLISLKDFMDRLISLPAPTTPSFDHAVLIVEYLQFKFEVNYDQVMNIRDVLKEIIRKDVRYGSSLCIALGPPGWFQKFISGPNTHVPQEVQDKLVMCMKEAFPQTYGGPDGPKDDGVSVYLKDEEWRMNHGFCQGADEQMVQLCFNPGKSPIGRDPETDKELKYTKYFRNLYVNHGISASNSVASV